MCGRYVSPDMAAMERYWELKRPGSPFAGLRDHPTFAKINYNTSPSQTVAVECLGANGPEIVAMRWGMDRREHDGTLAPRPVHNARVEGYKRTPPFADAWKNGRRGIQLVQGYYEWRETQSGKKIPFYIRPKDQGEVFGLAALWTETEAGLLTCAHITMRPGSLLAEIHERMPAILRAEDHQAWLAGTPDEAAACLKPYPDDQTDVRRVKPLVNNSRNNGPDLIEPDGSDEIL